MRKVKILALMIILVLVSTSCKNADPMAMADEIKADIEGSGSITITAYIKADYGDRAYGFKILCTKTPEETAVEIKEPESVAGVRAVCVDGGFELSFEDVQVTTGVLTRNGISPAEAVPALLEQWGSGYVTGAVFEKYDGADTVALDTHITDRAAQRTWFDTTTMLPIHSELMQDGVMVISCDFENIIIE